MVRKEKNQQDSFDNFLYGEVRGHKTTDVQERYLHMNEIAHGHHYLVDGKDVKVEVFGTKKSMRK